MRRRVVVVTLALVVLAVAGLALRRDDAGTPGARAPASAESPPPDASPFAPGPARAAGLAPATLRGAVLEAEGAPAAGATVTVLVDGHEVGRTGTAADGSFSVGELGPGDYVLVAVRGDLAAPPVGPVPLAAGEELAGFTMVLAPGGSLAGTVLDAGTRESIEGAHVTAAGAAAITDRVGRFRLRGLPPGPTVLRAWAPGYEAREGPLALSARAETGFEVTLARGARIRGRALGSSGSPVAGAVVRAVPYRLDGSGVPAPGATSAADGTFEVSAPAGPVRVEAFSPAGEAGKTDWMELAPGATREGVEVRLATAASLAGRVLDAAGAPVPGAEVRVASADGRPLAATAAGLDGSFAFSALPAGAVSVAAASGEARGHAGPVALAEGEAARVDVTLGAASLDGIVVDAGGRPVAGASVAAWPEGGARALAATGVSGSDGTFALRGLPAGLHRIEAAHGELRGEVRGVMPGTTGARIVVGGGLLVGSVFVGGSPATDFTVALSPLEPGQGGARVERVLAPDGRFRIPVAPGRWELRATAPGATVGAGSAEVPAAGESAEVRLELDAGATVTGVVLDPEGRPIEGARVSTSRFGNWGLTRASTFPGAPRTVTGPDGSFTLAGVPAGGIPVFASHERYRPARPVFVEVASGAPTPVELRLVPTAPGEEPREETSFGGVGMTLGPTRLGVMAFGVVPGGPAHEAGVRNGDLVLAVDGEPVVGRPIDEIVARVRGPVGTPVVFDLSRPSAEDVRFRAVAVRAELRL